MTRVLHVTESYGGGVAYAIESYIRNSPDVEHHVLATVREAAKPGGRPVDVPFTVLPAQSVKAISTLRRSVKTLQPDAVHAHSSIAGVLCRVALANRSTRRLIYTPHCYAFERMDVGLPARIFFRAAERLLVRNTSVLAACGEHEEVLSRELGHRDVRFIPNVASVGASQARPQATDPRPIISAGGRLSPQKDPQFFLETRRRLATTLPGARWRWVGGGDTALASRLGAADIEVTGWLPHQDSVARIAESTVYLHTARWEGFPLAVLEAVTMQVAVLVRPIRAFENVPELLHLNDENLTRLVPALPDADGAALEAAGQNLACWRQLLSHNTDRRQAEVLRQLYREAG